MIQETKNTLPEKARADVILLLQGRLSDAIDLMLQTKQAHWNVKGPQFIALHELFDKVNEHSRKWVDLLAERIVQLGGIAQGTARSVSSKTQLQDYPLTITDPSEHVELVSRALAAFGDSCRNVISELRKIEDPVSEDILIEIARSTDKRLWMVETHNRYGNKFKAKAA